MNPLNALVIGAIALTIGDIIAGKWVKNESKRLYFLILFSYMVGLGFLVYSYQFSDIVVASVVIEIANVVFLTFFCWYVFKQHITRTEVAGICIGLISVGILEFA